MATKRGKHRKRLSAVKTKPLRLSEPDDMTDVEFVVENKKIYFNKAVLAVCSPVFKTMFFSDFKFKEKEAKEIPLPGKKHGDMVIFLEQIHPVYSVTPLTDGVLEKLLSLSDEYQVDHIRQKCLQYIGSQINSRGWLPTEQVLLYLFVCERHQLIQHREILLNMAADQELLELERCDRFQCLEESTRAELIKTRCSQLEEKDRDSKYTEKLQIQREVMKTKAQMFDLPVCCFPLLPEKCVPCCYPCPHGLFPKRPSRYSSSFSSNPANCTNDSCVRSYMIRSYCKCCMTEKLKM